MKALVMGVSSYDTLIYMDEFPKKISDDLSLWAKGMYKTVGGTGAGKALALDALGIDTLLVTELGNDSQRTLVLEEFKEKKNLSVKVLDADCTTTHTNIMYGEGKRISIFTSYSQKVGFDPSLEAEIKTADVVFLNINDYCREYIPIIHQYHPLVVVDIHDYIVGNPYHQDFINAADILFVSGVHVDNKKSFLMDHIVGKKAVIITKGKNGSIAIDEHRNIYEQNAYTKLPYQDANGAGDTFATAFTIRYLKKNQFEDALKFASIAAAMACSSQKLYHPEASYSAVDKMMKTHF